MAAARSATSGRASDRQIGLYRLAREQIALNLELARPGLGFREFSEKAFPLPERYRANRYSTIAHGVGPCDAYAAVYYPEDAAGTGYDGVFEAGAAATPGVIPAKTAGRAPAPGCKGWLREGARSAGRSPPLPARERPSGPRRTLPPRTP